MVNNPQLTKIKQLLEDKFIPQNQQLVEEVGVDDNGDAQVTEVWNCKVTQGTEVYHPYYNLGNSEIKDLTVNF